MKIFAMLLRATIIIVWIIMLYLSWWNMSSPPFVSGIGFIVSGIYLVLQAIVWPKALLCPLFHKSEWCCKK